MKTLVQKLEDALAEIPIIDMHTHLVGGRLAARGLHDVMLYHMVVTELYSAGCPTGKRLTEYPGWPTTEEAHQRIREALPYLRHIQNTSIFWCLRIILRDLYNWHGPITEKNWQKLDALIRERADDSSWPHSILDRLNIRRSATEFARRRGGEDDDRLQYVMEWAMFNRCQWGEFDTALYELERCCGCPPGSPAPIGGKKRQPTERTVRSVADVREAMRYYVKTIPVGQVVATASTFSSEIDYREVSDAEMEQALSRRAQAGVRERDIYASYILEAFLAEQEKIADKIVYQFALGAEPLPFETGSRLPQRTLAQLGDFAARHPKIRFQCFLASRHGNQSLCTLARELPNISLAGYWWHNFFPDVIRQVMNERFDMVPANKQIGFFSDAYCVEWTYAKLVLVRKIMAQVLAAKIDQGQFTFDESIALSRAILFESPQSLIGMKPREISAASKKSKPTRRDPVGAK
jgi:glucuronate isomerase